MDKNKIAIFLFFIAIIFLIISNPFTLTGGVIGGYSMTNGFFILGIVFLIASFIVFTLRRNLDAIVIPTGGSYEIDRERADKAVEKYLGREEAGKRKKMVAEGKAPEKPYEHRTAKTLIISGTLGGVPIPKSQRAGIYKELRRYGIKPTEVSIEGSSRNTLENLLNVLEKLKGTGAEDIGIASNPSHLHRFEDVLRQAKKEGIVDKNFKIYEIKTPESFGDKFYGALSRIFYRWKLSKGLEEAKHRKTPNWFRKLANFGYRLMGKK